MNLRKQINDLGRQVRDYNVALGNLYTMLKNLKLDLDPAPQTVMVEHMVERMQADDLIALLQANKESYSFALGYDDDLMLRVPALETDEQVAYRVSQAMTAKHILETGIDKHKAALNKIEPELAKLKDEQTRIRTMNSAERHQHFKEQHFKETEAKKVQEKELAAYFALQQKLKASGMI